MAQSQAFVFPFEAPKTHLIHGARIVALPPHSDERGFLIALDGDQSLPFELRRVFCIYPSSPKAIRAQHATSAHCALVALQGAVDVDLDNGKEQASLRLARNDQALCIHAGVWLRLRNFAGGAILLVGSSQRYDETAYYDGPNLELLRHIAHDRWR